MGLFSDFRIFKGNFMKFRTLYWNEMNKILLEFFLLSYLATISHFRLLIHLFTIFFEKIHDFYQVLSQFYKITIKTPDFLYKNPLLILLCGGFKYWKILLQWKKINRDIWTNIWILPTLIHFAITIELIYISKFTYQYKTFHCH